jgi:hypothetical protein
MAGTIDIMRKSALENIERVEINVENFDYKSSNNRKKREQSSAKSTTR